MATSFRTKGERFVFRLSLLPNLLGTDRVQNVRTE